MGRPGWRRQLCGLPSTVTPGADQTNKGRRERRPFCLFYAVELFGGFGAFVFIEHYFSTFP
jgi:hypothetical protein